MNNPTPDTSDLNFGEELRAILQYPTKHRQSGPLRDRDNKQIAEITDLFIKLVEKTYGRKFNEEEMRIMDEMTAYGARVHNIERQALINAIKGGKK